MDINAIMKELAEYIRIAEENAAIIEGLKDQIKTYMSENNKDELIGAEHKATYKPIVNNRIDTTALKAELPDIAKRYTKSTSYMKFNFS